MAINFKSEVPEQVVYLQEKAVFVQTIILAPAKSSNKPITINFQMWDIGTPQRLVYDYYLHYTSVYSVGIWPYGVCYKEYNGVIPCGKPR